MKHIFLIFTLTVLYILTIIIHCVVLLGYINFSTVLFKSTSLKKNGLVTLFFSSFSVCFPADVVTGEKCSCHLLVSGDTDVLWVHTEPCFHCGSVLRINHKCLMLDVKHQTFQAVSFITCRLIKMMSW